MKQQKWIFMQNQLTVLQTNNGVLVYLTIDCMSVTISDVRDNIFLKHQKGYKC